MEIRTEMREIKFAVTKEGRKALVKAISEIVGCASVYKGAPSFAFVVQNYTIDRYGTVLYDKQTDEVDVRHLLAELTERGFAYECDDGVTDNTEGIAEGSVEDAEGNIEDGSIEDGNIDTPTEEPLSSEDSVAHEVLEDNSPQESDATGLNRSDDCDDCGEGIGESADSIEKDNGSDNSTDSISDISLVAVEINRTYKAELCDPEIPDRMEVFGADDDEDALRQAYGYVVDGVVLLELHELDENYDVIRSVDIPRDSLKVNVDTPITGEFVSAEQEHSTNAEPVNTEQVQSTSIEIVAIEQEQSTYAESVNTEQEQSTNTVPFITDTNDAEPIEISDHAEPTDKLIIEVPLDGFTATALENLDRLVSGKAALIMKAIGADALPIVQTESTLRFPWFTVGASHVETDAYAKFVHALCEMAKTQKRVTMKESSIDSEKFAFRCFLLRLGFIGKEYASARKVLLSKLSGSGSFKSGGYQKRSILESPMGSGSVIQANPQSAIIDGSDLSDIDSDTNNNTISYANLIAMTNVIPVAETIVVPERCSECQHHCYYAEGPMCTSTGEIVDTSNREPQKYTHYCLKAPSGFRRLKHAVDWSGSETPPKWCPLKGAAIADNNVSENSIDEEAVAAYE